MAEEPKTYTTKTGRTLTDADIEGLADEAEQGYDVEELRRRRRGGPLLGSAPADVVPVRLDPELSAAAEARAEADRTTLSDVIRQALAPVPRRGLTAARARTLTSAPNC